MLDIMNLAKRLSSLFPVPSLLFVGLALISINSASCGTDQACFYFTDVEYEVDNSCPDREEALNFFRGDFCSTPITAVDSDGTFDGSTCCYDVTQSNDFFDCGVGPVPPTEPFPGSTGVTTSGGGVGGIGGAGGAAGTGGMGGSGECATCQVFLTELMPPPLCGQSVAIYEEYSKCKCQGACKDACADSCATQSSSSACEECMLNTMTGCGNEHLACVDDN